MLVILLLAGWLLLSIGFFAGCWWAGRRQQIAEETEDLRLFQRRVEEMQWKTPARAGTRNGGRTTGV